MKRKPKSFNDRFSADAPGGEDDSDYSGPFGGQSRRQPQSGKPSFLNYTSLGILAAVFILGIGIGIAFSSTATISPDNVASREFIDRSALRTVWSQRDGDRYARLRHPQPFQRLHFTADYAPRMRAPNQQLGNSGTKKTR